MKRMFLYLLLLAIVGCETTPHRKVASAPATTSDSSTISLGIPINKSPAEAKTVVASERSLILITNFVLLEIRADRTSAFSTNFYQLVPAQAAHMDKFKYFLEICANRALDPAFVESAAELLHEIGSLKGVGEDEENDLLSKGIDLVTELAMHWPENPAESASCCDQINELSKNIDSMRGVLGQNADNGSQILKQIEEDKANISALGQAITIESKALGELTSTRDTIFWVLIGFSAVCFLMSALLVMVNILYLSKKARKAMPIKLQKPGLDAGSQYK